VYSEVLVALEVSFFASSAEASAVSKRKNPMNNNLCSCDAWNKPSLNDDALCRFISNIEKHLELPVIGISFGPERSEVEWTEKKD